MNTRSDSVEPPRLAAWLVSLFTSMDDECIVGDLHEEFGEVASRSGISVARYWYWRQCLRTIVDLGAGGFRGAPWFTSCAIVGGFLLLRFAHGLLSKLLSAVTDRYLMYWSGHFQAYLWVLKAQFPAYLLTSLLVGCMVALVAKKREMIATMALGTTLCAMILFGYLSALAKTGNLNFFWNMPWAFSDPLAIIMGGIFVRRLRSHKRALPAL